MPFNTIEEALADLQAGRMIVVVDDEDRENEGDLIMAASKVTRKRLISWSATDEAWSVRLDRRAAGAARSSPDGLP